MKTENWGKVFLLVFTFSISACSPYFENAEELSLEASGRFDRGVLKAVGTLTNHHSKSVMIVENPWFASFSVGASDSGREETLGDYGISPRLIAEEDLRLLSPGEAISFESTYSYFVRADGSLDLSLAHFDLPESPDKRIWGDNLEVVFSYGCCEGYSSDLLKKVRIRGRNAFRGRLEAKTLLKIPRH